MKPRLLDLFCGAGGCSVGYARAGFEVVGVDINPQPNYLFEFVQRDALKYLRGLMEYGPDSFDVVHASPPCQLFSAYQRANKHQGDHVNLIPSTRELVCATGLPYVIENVEKARGHLVDPIMLCGTGFGLGVQRHRLFETNFPMMGMPCVHGRNGKQYTAATNRETNSRRTVEVGVWRIPLEVQREAMGIDWMTLEELSEAIPPAYTEFIGHQLMQHLAAAQTEEQLT